MTRDPKKRHRDEEEVTMIIISFRSSHTMEKHKTGGMVMISRS